MPDRKQRTKNARRFLKIWFLTASQVLGILGALVLGHYLNLGFQGYLIGYVIGVLISFGATIGLS